jgi:hypothetical protein
LWQRSQWTQYKRSALIVGIIAVLAVAAILVGMQLTGWFSPAGQLLTITKPMGGTISSSGIKCGTRGSDCSTTLATGEPVELEAVADEGFAFSGFTGDCAPTGRIMMTLPRTCGAAFEMLSKTAPAAVWPLTITPPKGGTILAAGDIQCGTLDSRCSANIPDGAPVTLHAQADPGFTFLTYTGECAPTGNTLMTGPRACSATFVPSVSEKTPSTATAGVPRSSRVATVNPVIVDKLTTSTAETPKDPPPGPPVTVAVGEAPKPITNEEHAKKEIPGVIKEYCAALEALDPLRIQNVYPSANVRELREQFRQYKSLKCTITAPPEFIELNADGNVGTARVNVGVKQILEMKSGGAPKTLETIAETTLLRPELRSAWRISKVVHKAKPKE